MSMSKYSYFRTFGGPWRHVSASFTPRCMNQRVNYRSLSTVLSPQLQKPLRQQPEQPVRRIASLQILKTFHSVPKKQEAQQEPVEQHEPVEGEQADEAAAAGKSPVRRSNGYIVLEFEKKKKQVAILQFGEFWLRENCQCSKCIHPDTRQRAVDTFSIPKDVSAETIKKDHKAVYVDWSDGHVGVYPINFLEVYQNLPLKVDATSPTPVLRGFKTFPPNNPQAKWPTVIYKEVMKDDHALCDWLDKIYAWGFCFVTGVPIDPEKTKELIERIAFIRLTHYGGFWDFTADLSFKDTAYTTEFLGAHTDNTYFTDPARLQLFHLLSHEGGRGGESLLVDGFMAARILAERNLHHARVLAACPQPFHSSGNEDTCIQPLGQHPVFTCDRDFRRLYQIRWNNYDRAPKKNWGPKQQEEWYEAARHFDEITKREDVEVWTQLKPGTALIFDNWRMLHGRSQFVGKRRMCGGYVNNDDFLSKYRLLKFGREKVLQNLGNSDNDRFNPCYYF